ncbi:hypothetical protein POPTR_018G145550v4 [Populus trichocarpa]|uniref:Uncharacterized protein n=1 Tax=Populus trichocarpa TaxID=3694 RepID=A0ACC0RNX2_POPTR|nr:hypothetical protein BDE02_18G124600 [Populus trichocarpa]KAI9378803.1 hypothetical protein POPTR_018G145550v4 [Populus trichocarpa]
MALMETLYLSHGAPTLAIDETAPTRQFFKSWQQSVYKEKPSSILVISAHWETEPTVNVVDRNDTRLLWLPQALVPGYTSMLRNNVRSRALGSELVVVTVLSVAAS